MPRLAASARGAAEGVAAGQRGGPRAGVVPGPSKGGFSDTPETVCVPDRAIATHSVR